MNPRVKELAEQAGGVVLAGSEIQKFAELIVLECAACCGSQADKKNIRQRFGLPVESNVKYPGPDAHWSVTSQYTREYNIPDDK